MYVYLVAIIVILVFTFIKINKKEYYKLKRILKFAMSLPGEPILLSFTNSLQIACNYKETINYVEATTKKYGSLTRVILGKDMYIVLTKPEDYKFVLMNENGTNKSSVTKLWHIYLGDGILRASGTTHRLRRKTLQPLFNLKYLSEYIIFFNTYSNLCADTLEKNVDGPIFDLKPYIAQYAFNIFLVTAVGIQKMAHKAEDNEILYWQEKLLKEIYNRTIKPWLQIKWMFSLTETKKQMYIGRKNMLDFIYNISSQIATKQMALQYNNEISQNKMPLFYNYWNRLQQLNDNVISTSCKVSDQNFTDDITNIFAVIQNTITEVTSFIMLMLAMHTEVQEKLRQEISNIFEDNKIDAQRILSMQYFNMIFQETLRLFPIAHTVSRQLTKDIKLESCTLPNGCYVMIPIFVIHRNPEYWYKPLEFIPERFSSDNSSSRHRYAYIPFGIGSRDCLGQRYAFLSVATIIINLLQRFQFTTTNSNIDDIKLTHDIVLRSSGVKLFISRI